MTKRTSVRAQAREIYRGLAAAPLAANEATPTPDPSPRCADACGGGEKSPPSQSFGAASLTEKARALYETSAVPVREIAALAGVTERTIYKYAAKHKWKPRYRRPDFAPVQGAGARFIRRADKGKPIALGLKATDPAGAKRAALACQEAELLSDEAQAEAKRVARPEAMIHAIEANNFALSEYRRWRERRGRERAKQRDRAHAEKCATLPGRFRKREPKGPLPPPTPRDFLIEGVYLRLMTVALSRVEALVAEEKASRG